MNNILQSGGKSDKQIIDYIYVTDDGENKVLSLNKFLYIKEIGIYVLIIDESEIKQNIYNLLSQKYIEEKIKNWWNDEIFHGYGLEWFR